MEDPRDTVVVCRSTAQSTGCGHPVDDHTGPASPRQDCPCCSWGKERALPVPVRNPPPAGVSPEKWASMSRRERRALERKVRRDVR